jgi:histidinol dehydrogenase
VRIVRLGDDATATHVRALTDPPRAVEADVRAIVEEVRADGDGALARLTRRLDGVDAELTVALHPAATDTELTAALETSIANVDTVARATLREPARVRLPQGHTVELTDVPVRRAGAYVPGGRAPYVSTVVMCAVTARVAGVERIAVCSPPPVDPAVVAACRMCGVDELYALGGAQAIAALAYGTRTIAPVDVIVGPGNAYVTEAKRQVRGDVAIDGLAGPSELVIVAAGGADPQLAALDLLAQAEHGPSSLCAAVSPDSQLLDGIVRQVESLGPSRPSVTDAPLAVVPTRDIEAAIALANDIAPEHLQLMGAQAEAQADRVYAAGCLFVGTDAATAFGDYVAGSNHVLPTGGAARFESALSVATFRRRMARVSLPAGAAARLAPAGAALSQAEGFPVHGESMEQRA